MMDINRKTYYISILLFIAALFGACDDMDDINDTTGEGAVAPESGTAEFYVLSEGLFNLNNSTLMRYTFHDNKAVGEYFRTINRRGLGDTANDMALYGSRLYVVVNVSSQIEVIDHLTGESVKRIPLLTDNGSSRQPRNITFDKDKAYVCSFDGTVTRIDTTSLAIDAVVNAGRNPDGICVANNKLYVSNSGGLDNPDYDNTVSVIDIPSFAEVRKITVGNNPGRIAADASGYVYVAVRGDAGGNADPKSFVCIDSRTDEIRKSWDEPVLDFAIDGDFAYAFNYDYQTKTSQVKVLNLLNETVEEENFIADGTRIETPYRISVNPFSGNVYITDAYDYKVKGDVLCFNPQGRLQFRINNAGLNPGAVAFSDRLSQSTIDDDPGNTDTSSAFADRVLQYSPAPGQFINTTTSAYRDGYSHDEVLALASEQIRKRSLLTLGGYGGYLTLGFDHTIPNKAGEYDFKVYGNASRNTNGTGSSEPGIILVARDANGNGLPDDEWYELAGSEYHSESVIKSYEITYYRPTSPLLDVAWKDNQGNSGIIPRNTSHVDNSYYPAWTADDELTFTGSRLPDNGVNEGTETSPNWVQYAYSWGYADNQPNSTEFSRFNIDWAVDKAGNTVLLDGIDFIRIYTAVNQVCGWMGETSTEVSTIEDLHFDN